MSTFVIDDHMLDWQYDIADCSDKEPKYFMFPFYQMKTESIIKRKEKERFFIRTFLPKLNAL